MAIKIESTKEPDVFLVNGRKVRIENVVQENVMYSTESDLLTDDELKALMCHVNALNIAKIQSTTVI